MAEYIGAAKCYPFTTIPNRNIYHDIQHTAHLYIVDCSIVQYSLAVEEEEESSHPCVEFEVPRELLLHTEQLMPPLEIEFKSFEENG